MAGETKFCPECGKTNPVGMCFCGHCGAALPAPAETTVPEFSEADENIEPTQNLETAAPAGILPAVPTVAAAPPIDIEVPADPIARERERERLLSLASVQRMRAQILDARTSLQKAIIISEGMPGSQVAPIHEMLGDMLAAEERWGQAASAYEKAQILDPSRSSAERKFGDMTLRIADEKAMAKLGSSLDSGGTEVITSGSQAKRNPGFAILLSLIMPGFGQFYNGQFVKACICLGIFVLAIFIITWTPDIRALRCLFIHTAGCSGLTISPLSWFCIFAASGAWLYSVVDAPYSASKTQDTSADTGPVIDKSGWEV